MIVFIVEIVTPRWWIASRIYPPCLLVSPANHAVVETITPSESRRERISSVCSRVAWLGSEVGTNDYRPIIIGSCGGDVAPLLNVSDKRKMRCTGFKIWIKPRKRCLLFNVTQKISLKNWVRFLRLVCIPFKTGLWYFLLRVGKYFTF